jgi:hypothetical protein
MRQFLLPAILTYLREDSDAPQVRGPKGEKPHDSISRARLQQLPLASGEMSRPVPPGYSLFGIGKTAIVENHFVLNENNSSDSTAVGSKLNCILYLCVTKSARAENVAASRR